MLGNVAYILHFMASATTRVSWRWMAGWIKQFIIRIVYLICVCSLCSTTSHCSVVGFNERTPTSSMERMKIALLYKIEKFNRNGMMIGQIDIAFCMRS